MIPKYTLFFNYFSKNQNFALKCSVFAQQVNQIMYNMQYLNYKIQYWQMLIKNLYARQLTTIITFSMELQKEPVVKYFDKNFKIAREQIQKISAQFGMNKDQGCRLFHFYPLLFKPQSKEFESFKQRVQSIKSISSEKDPLQLRSVLNKVMFNSNHLTISMTKEDLDSLVETVNNNFTSKPQVQKIFSQCPNLLNPKFKYILQQKLALLQDHLGFSRQKSMEIFETSPFLLSASTRKLRQSIISLFRVYELTKEQIGQQMKSMGEIFLLGGPVLQDIYKTPVKWGLKNEEIKSIFLKNPLLFLNYPYNVMPKKKKILKYLNFTQPMGQKLFREYPSVLISSIRSLQEKALFITNRLQIKLNINSVEVLTFNFNKILRPRGQLLVKSKTLYDKDNILTFMKMTNQQFVQKLGLPLEKLNEEIAKFEISEELDFRNNKIFKKIGTKQKVIKLASNYSH